MDAFVDKIEKKKEAQRLREDGLYQDFLESEGIESIPPEEEIFVRKMIRKDAKDMIRIEREQDGIYSDDETADPYGWHRMDTKVIYGSSSEDDIDREVHARWTADSTSESGMHFEDEEDGEIEMDPPHLRLNGNLPPEEIELMEF
jgi:hypothetical protein